MVALSMRTILRTWPNATLAQQTFVLDKLHSFVQWVVRVQNQPDPHNIDVRTEPKFNLPNGDVFTGSWCRPQTDGPAIRSTTLLLFAQQLLA
jgi:glucoamylase